MTRPMTSEALRRVADWLDTYDRFAEACFTRLERDGMAPSELAALRTIVQDNSVQDDLRAWADQLTEAATAGHAGVYDGFGTDER